MEEAMSKKKKTVNCSYGISNGTTGREENKPSYFQY
jgi:hypothetical protein